MHSRSVQALTDVLHTSTSSARDVGAEVRAGVADLAGSTSERLAEARRTGRRRARKGRKAAARALRRAESRADRLRSAAASQTVALQQHAAEAAGAVSEFIGEHRPAGRTRPSRRGRRLRLTAGVLAAAGAALVLGRLALRWFRGDGGGQPVTAPVRAVPRRPDSSPGESEAAARPDAGGTN
jgi:hypothetical protein